MPTSRTSRAVLCPVDFSSNARQALRYAVSLTRRLKARLHVLFVDDELLTTAATQVGDLQRPERTMTELRRFVERTIGRPRSIGVRCHVAVGEASRQIVAVAAALRCDLVVMGTQGVGGVRKWLVGSTTNEVLKRSRVPVLTIPPRR